jgi:hypothetical protein
VSWDSNVRNLPIHAGAVIPAGSALYDVYMERQRQDNKWGLQEHMPDTWISILGEEYGEACAANNEKDGEQYRKELVETAAVAVAAVEAYDRGFWKENSANGGT